MNQVHISVILMSWPNFNQLLEDSCISQEISLSGLAVPLLPRPHELLRSNQAGRDPAHRLLTTLLSSEQMNLNAARKIEASLNGSLDLHALFYANH
jgi:hypothetical protein